MNVLTTHQLKIFRHWLVTHGFYPSYTKAIKATGSHTKCHEVFLQVVNLAEESWLLAIEELLDVYVVDDNETVDCVHDKVDSNTDCVSNKNNTGDCVPDKVDSNTDCVPKKGRGKQKTPTLKHYPVRLSVEVLEQLRQMDGNVSDHIRLAISQYVERNCKGE